MIDSTKVKDILAKADCLFDQQALQREIDRMATEIAEIMGDEHPLLLCVMTGGMFVTSELALRLNFPLEIDYVHASRYQGGIRPGDLHWRVEPRIPIEGRTILIVDDILDGGLTFGAIVDYCHTQGASKVYTAVLADKDHKRDENGLEKADFTGVNLPDRYVFGYGLDYEETLRNAPGIYAVAEEHDA